MTDTKTQQKHLLVTLFNSTAIYMTCLILLRVMIQGLTSFIAYDQEISNIWKCQGIEFLEPFGSSNWTFDAIVSIFMAGPLLSLVVGIISISAFTFHLLSNPTKINYVLWALIIGYNFFFGAIVAGLITKSGIAIVLQAMNFLIEIKIMIAILASFIQIKTGLLVAPGILKYSNHIKIDTTRERFLFLSAKILLPWIIGNIFITIIFPEIADSFFLIAQAIAATMILPIILKGTFSTPPAPYPKHFEHRISIRNVIFFVLITVSYKLLFSSGIILIY